MKGAGVHHLDLVVSSLDRSLPLYQELLRPLGYDDAHPIVGERGERVVYLNGPGLVSVSLREAQSPGSYDRYALGVHHVAVEAPSRAVVDERLRWAKENGLEVENEPREWQYQPGYYAGFFHDPDGIKLEIVHIPERSTMSTMPPGEQPTTPPRTMPAWGNMPPMARLPIPGNAEFLFWVFVVLLSFLVCWISDNLGAESWLDFLKWVSVAYILSRGIAKASRVLEQ